MTFAVYPSLAGRVVFISGGATGIGSDMVRAFAGNGAKVAFIDILESESKALCEELGSAAHRPFFLPCDVTDIPALQAAIETVRQHVGPVGVLVNSAANDNRVAIDEVTPDYWDNSQNINLRHHFFAAQAVRPHMRELGGGSIINFSSISYRHGADGMAPYATAKSAVIGLTKALARGFGPDNIRVNAIEPGAVVTERQIRLWYKSQEAVDAVVSRQLIRRTLIGEEIARTVLFLAADDSRMITKQTIVVDAGLS